MCKCTKIREGTLFFFKKDHLYNLKNILICKFNLKSSENNKTEQN